LLIFFDITCVLKRLYSFRCLSYHKTVFHSCSPRASVWEVNGKWIDFRQWTYHLPNFSSSFSTSEIKSTVPYIAFFYKITKSQNHTSIGIGRDLCRSSSPTTLPKQGHLEHIAQDLIQMGFE